MGRFDFRGLRVKESEALLFTVVIALFVSALVFTVLNSRIRQTKSRIDTLRKQYRKALTLYEKIKKQENKRAVFRGNILLLVQNLQKNANIKRKIIAVSTTADGNAIVLKLRHLNLSELLTVLKGVEQYKNVKVKHLVLRKSFTSNKLLDLDLTVAKTE